MYAFPDMVEYGLINGQKFPSEMHRRVAENLCIANPNVTTRDKMTKIVQAVLKVPDERITTVTCGEMMSEFGCPKVWMYEGEEIEQ